MWIWKGKVGGKGGGKSGRPPPSLGKGTHPTQRHYVQCKTTGCNGHVFQVQGKEVPEKCKVCNFCNTPFVIPILPAIGAGTKGNKGNAGKGGNQNPKKKKEEDAAAVAPSHLSAAASVAPGKITSFYENLIEHGYSEEAALEQLTALGLKLPKKVLPKTVDEYDRLASINKEIKRYQNDISGQSEKYYRMEQATEDLLNTILEKQNKLAELKSEQVTLHQSITKADPPVEHDRSSLNAVLQAELEQLSVMRTYIESQPNVPEQVKHFCSRVEYVKVLTQKTFDTQFATTEAFDYAAALVEITSDELKKVGEDDFDDDYWPEGFEIAELDQAMDGQPEGELATANVVSSSAGSRGHTAPPPSNSETEYPSYNMANWSHIKKKAIGLDMPRPAKVPKSLSTGSGTQVIKDAVE